MSHAWNGKHCVGTCLNMMPTLPRGILATKCWRIHDWLINNPCCETKMFLSFLACAGAIWAWQMRVCASGYSPFPQHCAMPIAALQMPLGSGRYVWQLCMQIYTPSSNQRSIAGIMPPHAQSAIVMLIKCFIRACMLKP